jgi:hypothetical protein
LFGPWGLSRTHSFVLNMWSVNLERAVPFWASLFVLATCYTMFIAPVFDQGLYFKGLEFSVMEFRIAMMFGFAGMNFTMGLGSLEKRFGHAVTVLGGAVLATFSYGLLMWAWSGAFAINASLPLLAAITFVVGQSAAWYKVAAIATTAETLDMTKHLGKSFGVLFTALEFANCLYTMITEVWCVWGCDLEEGGKAAVAARHLPIALVGFVGAGLFYDRPNGAPKATAQDCGISGLVILYAALIGLSYLNWFQQDGWCYAGLFSVSWGTIKTRFIDCWIPTWLVAFWLLGFVGLLLARLCYAFYGSFEVAAKSTPSGAASPAAVPSSPAVVPAQGGPAGAAASAGGEGTAKTEKSAGASEKAEGTFHSKGIMEQASMYFVVGTLFGVGQTIATNYWFITESYSTSKGDALMDSSGVFLFARMVGALVAGCLWDYRPGLPFWHGFRLMIGASADLKKNEESAAPMLRSRVVPPLAGLMALSQLIFAFGPHSGFFAVFSRDMGFLLSGFSTGAITAVVPMLAVQWDGDRDFIARFSNMMLAGIVGTFVIFFAVDTVNMHYEHDDDDAIQSILQANDDNISNEKWSWGGCSSNPGCFKASFVVHLVLLTAATGLSYFYLLEDELPRTKKRRWWPSTSRTQNADEATNLLAV